MILTARVSRVLRACKDRLAMVAATVKQEISAQEVAREIKALLEHKVQQAAEVHLALRVMMVAQARLDNKARLEISVI